MQKGACQRGSKVDARDDQDLGFVRSQVVPGDAAQPASTGFLHGISQATYIVYTNKTQ